MYINIETKRLRIRPIKLTDAAFILELVNSEGWLKFIGDRNISNKTDAEKYIQNILEKKDHYYNVFEIKESKKSIGVVTFLKRENELFPDLGFALLPKFEKKGYTIEVSKEYLKQIIKSKKHENLFAITLPNNQKSISLLKKLGLNYEFDFKKDNEILSYFSLNNLKKPAGNEERIK
jgi:RimJ/RimL family protein N-acetyltransferase